MPLVRIDLRRGKDIGYRQAIGEVVYRSLAAAGVPEHDRFQVVQEHNARNFLYDGNYLGIRRTDDLVMIQISWNAGRTVEQKRALYRSIAEGLSDAVGLRREDVFINLIDVGKENWSFGNGEAQYAV